ncbi:hypothetical protein F5051DRAFT_403721 [Lentinula edodes]|nr:hypothetical protein F5051DRAFT_403721 [Lentinula edodes]
MGSITHFHPGIHFLQLIFSFVCFGCRIRGSCLLSSMYAYNLVFGIMNNILLSFC